MDDIAVVRSMRNDHNNHFEATLGIHRLGRVQAPKPWFVGHLWAWYGEPELALFVPGAGDALCGQPDLVIEFSAGHVCGHRITGGAEPVQDLNRRAPSV